MIQIYGRFDSWWSHSQVSRGIVAGLYRNRIEDLQVFSLNRYGGYEGLSEPIARGGYNVRVASGQLADAPVGFFVGGYPTQIGEWLDQHAFKAALLICESVSLPPHWGAIANRLDLVAVPSEWTKKAYIACGVDPSKLLVVPHGIHTAFTQSRNQIDDASTRLRFLHIAGARDFLDRKGTPQLIEAFRDTFAPDEATLTIRTPANPELKTLCAGARHIKLEFSDEPMPVWRMVEYLRCGWSALVQPSRAEAFGIIPIEARALGLPVITTHCTGHKEHAHPTDTVVQHGPLRNIRVQGIPNGAAPEVDASSIANALQDFAGSAPKTAPEGYGRRWLWSAVCQQLAYRLRTAAQQHKSRTKRLDDNIFGG